MRALLLAVKSDVQDFLGLTLDDARDAIVDVTEDGRPKPVSEGVFYGIVGTGFSNMQDQCLRESYSVKVVITLWASYAPHDRLGNELVTKETTGLWDRVGALRARVHMRYQIMDAANTTMGVLVDEFDHPLVFQNANYLGVKGPEWFDAEGGEDEPPAGIAVELLFGGAERTQTIESQA